MSAIDPKRTTVGTAGGIIYGPEYVSSASRWGYSATLSADQLASVARDQWNAAVDKRKKEKKLTLKGTAA